LKFVKSIFTVCSYRVYLHFDHHLTTTVQSPLKMPKKPVVITDNRLFPVLGAAVQSQQNLRFSVCLRRLAVVFRRQVPGVRILSGALKKRLLHKEKIQVQQPPVLMKEKRREYPVTGSVQTVPQ
jgi:hypothetical protein